MKSRVILIFSFFLVGWIGTAVLPAAPAAAAGDPVIMFAGDIALGGHEQQTSDLILAQRASSEGLAAALTLGDNAYSDGTDAQFATRYNPTWGRFKDITKPSPGNHDYHTIQGYYNYFFGGQISGNEYYSYDIGSWHFIALNSNIPRDAASPQVAWLKADLAKHPKSQCMAAYWHHPRYSSGSKHGSDASTGVMYQALLDGGADAVLVGHDHLYERFDAQNNASQASASGIKVFLVGTAGNSIYPFGSILPNSVKHDNTTPGVMKFTLHPSSYDFNFVPVPGVGSFTDSGSSTCQNGGSTQPGFSVSSASPTSGDVAGGTVVTINGSGFAAGASLAVSFGGSAGTSVSVLNSSQIRATTPAHAAGAVNIVVTNGDGASGTLSSGFTYTQAAQNPTVTSVNPNTGPAAGGTATTITGTNFLSGATVKFGTASATAVSVASATSLTATTPAGTAGQAVTVTVTNSGGAAGSLANGFTYSPTQPPQCNTDTSKGIATKTITIPSGQGGTFRIWSRLQGDNINNSYVVRVDDTLCSTVGNSPLTPGAWTWVDYHDGAAASKIDVTLGAGNHKIDLIGKEDGVKLDRIMFVSDGCVPTATGKGEPCDQVVTPVTVSLAANGSTSNLTVDKGTTVNLAATVTGTGITTVKFTDGLTAISEDASSPYTATWPATAVGDHVITATAYDSANQAVSNDTLTVTVKDVIQPGGTGIRINAGGPAYTAANGDQFVADQSFVGGQTRSNTNTIAGTNDQTLYQTTRFAMSAYNIPVQAGTYTLKLHFAEVDPNLCRVGGRVFGVKAEGAAVLSNYDIFAAVGCNRADVKTSSVTVSDGTLNLDFVTGVENPKINAIEVIGATGNPTTKTFNPTDDVFAKETEPNRNMDGFSFLRASNSASATCSASPCSGSTRQSFLKFNLTGLGSSITSAKLRLYVNTGSASGGSVFKTDTTWTETALTWANKPAAGVLAAGPFGAVAAGGYVDINLTPSALPTSGDAGLVLTNDDKHAVEYASRESSHQPQLVITSQ